MPPMRTWRGCLSRPTYPSTKAPVGVVGPCKSAARQPWRRRPTTKGEPSTSLHDLRAGASAGAGKGPHNGRIHIKLVDGDVGDPLHLGGTGGWALSEPYLLRTGSRGARASGPPTSHRCRDTCLRSSRAKNRNTLRGGNPAPPAESRRRRTTSAGWRAGGVLALSLIDQSLLNPSMALPTGDLPTPSEGL